MKKEFAKKDKKPEPKKDEPVLPSIEAAPVDDDKEKEKVKEE